MLTKLHFSKHQLLTRIIALIPLVFPFTIPFAVKANSWALAAVTIYFFFWAIKHKTIKSDLLTNLFWAMSGLFLVLVLGLTYTSNLRQGMAELEKNIGLLIFPFVVFQWKKLGICISRILWAFTAGCILVTSYGIAKILLVIDVQERSNIFRLGHSYYSSYINLHPTYLSIYFIIITIFLVDLMVRRKVLGTLQWFVVVGLVMYSIVFILFLRSRIAIPLTLIAAGTYFFLLNSKRWKELLLIFALCGSTAFIFFTHDINQIIDEYGRNFEIALGGRLNVWQSSFEGYKLSPILGAGTGAAQELIDQGYLKVGHDEGLDNSYNAHNQYLQFLCSNGIIGLGMFLILLVIITKGSIVAKNALFLTFITVFCFAMISESILYVQKGIVSFYFLATCFYYLRND